jgi:NADPH:quinone reductase-like Zn-dependent oxidoreductase
MQLDEQVVVGRWPDVVAPGKVMTAVAFSEFGGPDVLVEQLHPVAVVRPGEVLVQVAAVSVGRWLDVAARAGNFPYRGFHFPHVLGAEHAGLVVAVGAGVTRWNIGDRVACFPVVADLTCELCARGFDELCPAIEIVGTHRPGAYAEYVSVPARNLHGVPDGVSPAQAAGLALSGAVAMNQLLRSGFKSGDWSVVQGASSGLGSVTASLILHLGGHVIATSRSEDKRRRLDALGVNAALDATAEDFVATVLELTGGRGANIVVDNLGEPKIWATSLACLASAGTLVSSGSFLGRDVSVPLQRLYLFGQHVLGVRSGNIASVRALWDEVDRGFRPILDRAFPLAQAAEAHRYLESDQNMGRVVLLVEPRR